MSRKLENFAMCHVILGLPAVIMCALAGAGWWVIAIMIEAFFVLIVWAE